MAYGLHDPALGGFDGRVEYVTTEGFEASDRVRFIQVHSPAIADDIGD